MSKAVDELNLLDAASREFSAHGYEGVSMRELSERLGVTTQILYSRFESKEALYDEACEYALDAFFDLIDQRLTTLDPGVGGPQMLAEAFFDAWMENRVPLLLTNRGVINTCAAPQNRRIERHYTRVIRLITELAARHCQRDVTATAAFSFAAVTFGYCSLMIVDENHQRMLGEMSDPGARARYVLERKATLVAMCGALWKDSDFPALTA